MVDPQMERMNRHLTPLKLTATRERLDALLQRAAKAEETYLEFLDNLLQEEVASKDEKRTRMMTTIARFPLKRTLDDFDFELQPSIDRKLIRELETGRFIANGHPRQAPAPQPRHNYQRRKLPAAGEAHGRDVSPGCSSYLLKLGAAALRWPP